MGFDIRDPFKGSSLKGFGFKRYTELEDFIDKQFNLRLQPELPQFPGGGKKAAKKAKDYSSVIASLQRRMLKSVAAPGRAATIGTSPRGVV